MVVHESQRETGDTEGGSGKAKDQANKDNDNEAVGPRRDLPTPVLEASAVVPESQHETGEIEGGGEEMRVEADTYEGDVADEEAESGKEGRVGNRSDRKMI